MGHKRAPNKILSDLYSGFQKVWNIIKLPARCTVCTSFSRAGIPSSFPSELLSVQYKLGAAGAEGQDLKEL